MPYGCDLASQDKVLRAEDAERERERLRRENERLRQQVEHLKRQLDEARRAGFRQAAPFAKPLKKDPKRPGRKTGHAYGRKGHRRMPPRVDERYDVPLPAQCPTCAGSVVETPVTTQYQEELPATGVIVRQHAIRPIVVTRKVCGGNRSRAGADSQQILASVVRAAASQRDVNPHLVLASMLHLRTPRVVAELN